MQNVRVKELMVPLSDYATVDENALMFEAVLALEHSRERFDHNKLKHRAVIVTNNRKQVVGKIGYLDFLQSLEPGYSVIPEMEHMGSSFTPEFLRSQLQKYALWQTPLNDLCGKAAHCQVKEFMHIPAEAEYIDADDSLDQAIHQLILTRVQSLLVKSGQDVVGILRLSDVAETLLAMIRECKI
ncbi:MAG: CBS domain-containing protein [Desulfatirhabdiaceae bacterium]